MLPVLHFSVATSALARLPPQGPAVVAPPHVSSVNARNQTFAVMHQPVEFASFATASRVVPHRAETVRVSIQTSINLGHQNVLSIYSATDKKGEELHTSRLRIKSFTTLMILPIVDSNPPSSLSGRAKSIACPLRSRPRERRRLLIYADAVRKLSDSIVVVKKYLFTGVYSNMTLKTAVGFRGRNGFSMEIFDFVSVVQRDHVNNAKTKGRRYSKPKVADVMAV